MASSSGTMTATTTTTQTSSSSEEAGQEEELLQARMVEQKKRRRMQSNRESARRSRMRKQQHAEGLAAQAAELRAENARLLSALALSARTRAAVDADNAVLRAQLLELSARLGSLNEMIRYLDYDHHQQPGLYVNQIINNNNNNIIASNNSWNSNLGCTMNQQQHPIMASADMLHYYYY